jgi:hypothetical protein
MVDRLPPIAARAQRLRSLADKVQRHLGDHDLFLRYEDERLEQKVAREEVYFNSGFEQGLLAAQTKPAPEMGAAAKMLTDRLKRLVAGTHLPEIAVAAVILDHARALLGRLLLTAESTPPTRSGALASNRSARR